MYLGKPGACSILNTSQACWAAAILPCCDREATSGGGTKYSCKSFTVNIDVDLYTLKTLNSTENSLQRKNSVFATHCTVNTLDVVHTDGHAVAIHGVTPSTIFSRSSEFYNYSWRRSRTETFCTPLKLMLCYKLNTLPVQNSTSISVNLNAIYFSISASWT